MQSSLYILLLAFNMIQFYLSAKKVISWKVNEKKFYMTNFLIGYIMS